MNAITNSILYRIQQDINANGYANYMQRCKRLVKLLSITAPDHSIAVTSDYTVFLTKIK